MPGQYSMRYRRCCIKVSRFLNVSRGAATKRRSSRGLYFSVPIPTHTCTRRKGSGSRLLAAQTGFSLVNSISLMLSLSHNAKTSSRIQITNKFMQSSSTYPGFSTPNLPSCFAGTVPATALPGHNHLFTSTRSAVHSVRAGKLLAFTIVTSMYPPRIERIERM
jgi:hypothetical protein